MDEAVQHKALITGGTRGIGLAIAQTLARRGFQIVITYLNDEKQADDALAGLPQSATPKAFACDVTSREAVKALFKQLKEEDALPDVIVNNAGVLSTNYIRFMSPDEWHKPIETSLTGSFHVTQAALRSMMRKKWGRIINIASDAGLMGDAMRASYAAAKAGMLGLTRATAREVAQMGITVNSVAPGLIKTRMTEDMPQPKRNSHLSQIPLGRFGSPIEVANVVAFLASDDAEFITGQTISVDGGLYMRS